MSFARVQARGQVTLSRDVRRRAGINPGDQLLVVPDGPGKVRLEVIPRVTLGELLQRYRIHGSVDLPEDRERVYDALAVEVFETMARNTPGFTPPR